MAQFYSERIEVKVGDKAGQLVSFQWRGVEHKILEVIASWHDWGFGRGAPRKKNWRLRRHRNYYRVATEEGRTFEIYLDRSREEKEWVLYKEL